MKGRTINTAELHDVVLQRKKEYGKFADVIDGIIEEMVAATPTTDRTVQDFVDKCRECGKQEKTNWIIKAHGFPPEPTTVCAKCGFDRDFNIEPRYFDKIKYCPNCGRKLSGIPTGSEKKSEADKMKEVGEWFAQGIEKGLKSTEEETK